MSMPNEIGGVGPSVYAGGTCDIVICFSTSSNKLILQQKARFMHGSRSWIHWPPDILHSSKIRLASGNGDVVSAADLVESFCSPYNITVSSLGSFGFGAFRDLLQRWKSYASRFTPQ